MYKISRLLELKLSPCIHANNIDLIQEIYLHML